MAAGAIFLVLLSGQILAVHSVVRDWLPAVWLLLGYWLPGGLQHEPMPGVEAWLRASDRWLHKTPWAREAASVALGGAGGRLLPRPRLRAGGIPDPGPRRTRRFEHFWTPVLLAGYACYGTLPWLQARPPRLVESADAEAGGDRRRPLPLRRGRVRGWNERVLDLVSVKANTLPQRSRGGRARRRPRRSSTYFRSPA